MAPEIRHIVQTRFAVQTKKLDDIALHANSRVGDRGAIPLSPEWVAQRFTLFEQYLLPSMRAQTFTDFVWYLYVHPGFDPAACDRLRAYDSRIRVVTDSVSPLRESAGILACTRIDSDDGFASHALEVVHRYAGKFAAGRQPVQLLRLKEGWWNDHTQSRVYPWRGWSFLTLLERRAPYRGALGASCMEIGRIYPEWTELHRLWLRVVHDGNVRNRLDRAQPTIGLQDLRDQGFAWLPDQPSKPDPSDPGLPDPELPTEMPEPAPDPSLPRVALVMQTTDRRRAYRHVQANYVRRTVTQLVQQGAPLRLQLSKVHDLPWIQRELGSGLLARVRVQPTSRNLSRNATGLAALGSIDLDAVDWVVLLEDDLIFCRDFLPSVQRWLRIYGRSDRHIFRFWGAHHPRRSGVSAFDHPLAKLACVQAMALRADDLRDFLPWAAMHLPTWRGFGPRMPDPGIAFDKFIALWALTRWPGVPGVLSWPFFVDHIGLQSSIHARGPTYRGFGGVTWSFETPATPSPQLVPEMPTVPVPVTAPVRATRITPWPYRVQPAVG